MPIEQTDILLDSGPRIIDRTEAEVANTSEVKKSFIVEKKEKILDIGKHL